MDPPVRRGAAGDRVPEGPAEPGGPRRTSRHHGPESRGTSCGRRARPTPNFGLADPKLTDEELLAAMIEHPILINRPIVRDGQGRRALPSVREGAAAPRQPSRHLHEGGRRSRGRVRIGIVNASIAHDLPSVDLDQLRPIDGSAPPAPARQRTRRASSSSTARSASGPIPASCPRRPRASCVVRLRGPHVRPPRPAAPRRRGARPPEGQGAARPWPTGARAWSGSVRSAMAR